MILVEWFVNKRFHCFLGALAMQHFIPRTCLTPSSIGSSCNIPADQCNMLKPCQNDGICINNNTLLLGYICSCPSGFNGTQCQFDNRPCQPNTCWNNGRSNEEIIMKLFISF